MVLYATRPKTLSPADPCNKVVGILYGLRQPSADQVQEAVMVLANLATLIGDKLGGLSTMPAVLQSGKVIGQKSAKE